MLYLITKTLAISFALTLAIGLILPDEDVLPYGTFPNIFSVLDEPLQDINTCSKYTCKTSSQEFKDDTCGYYNPNDGIIYSRPCKDKSNNCFTTNLLGNRTCVSNIPVEMNLPGDKCSKTEGCYWATSLECNDGKCQGTSIGKNCDSTEECNPGTSCRSINGVMQCASLIEIGETGCLSQFDCVYAGGCNITSLNDPTQNTCIKYGSLLSGTEISQETCNKNSKVCYSSKCAKNHEGKYLCTGPIVSKSQLPITCTYAYNSTVGCESVEDSYTGATISTLCACAWNKNGDSYCQLQAGDQPEIDLWTETLKWRNSPSAQKCHTYWRVPTYVNNRLQCISEHYDSKSYSVLLYRYVYANLYVTLYDSEDCVIKTFFSYYLKDEDNNDNDGNGDNGLCLAFSLLLFVTTLN